MKVYSGGGASNTAVSYARLGFKTAAVCETGRDNFAQIVINDLINEGYYFDGNNWYKLDENETDDLENWDKEDDEDDL